MIARIRKRIKSLEEYIMVKIQMNKKMSNSLYNNVEISNAVERSVNDTHGAERLLKLENEWLNACYISYFQQKYFRVFRVVSSKSG